MIIDYQCFLHCLQGGQCRPAYHHAWAETATDWLDPEEKDPHVLLLKPRSLRLSCTAKLFCYCSRPTLQLAPAGHLGWQATGMPHGSSPERCLVACRGEVSFTSGCTWAYKYHSSWKEHHRPLHALLPATFLCSLLCHQFLCVLHCAVIWQNHTVGPPC